jgi:AcrR family transcriptional regulator
MVGRATLYRNFPDREALTEAVREHYLTELTAQVAQWKGRSDAFLLGIRSLANLTIARSGFEKIVPLSRQSPAATKRVRARINDILAEPLIRAKAAGLVRADFEPADVQLAALMVAAGGLDYDRDTTAGIEKALELLMRGLAPESRQRTRPRS